jgi:hypothetical protein
VLKKGENDMEKILECLCLQWMNHSPSFYERKDVEEQYKKMFEIEKQLENYFNKDDLILIRQALDEQSNCDSMQSFDYFVQGIRCGVQLYDEIKEADINQLYGLKYG